MEDDLWKDFFLPRPRVSRSTTPSPATVSDRHAPSQTVTGKGSLATGGAGTIFEYRVAAMLFSRLLRGAHVPVGPQLPLARVALQQRNAGFPFDDIVAYADSHADSVDGPVSIQFQVKRRIQATGQNAEFIKIMKAAVEVCRTHPDRVADGHLLMGLAAGAPADQLAALARLTEMARAYRDHEGPRGLLREGVTDGGLRRQYNHVVTAVSAAAGTDDGDEICVLTHRILTGLHVWHVLAGSDDRDWRAEIDGLAVLADGTGTPASVILEHLLVLAQEFGSHSGMIEAAQLRRELRSRFDLRLSPPTAAVARQAPRISVVNSGSGTVIVGENQVFNGFHIGS